MPITYQQIPEQRLRLAGYLTIAATFFSFFMLQIASSWQDVGLYFKVLLLTILHTMAVWEPTRLFIMQLRKQLAGIALVKRRLQILIGVAVPYAFLLGVARIYFEERINLWGVSTSTAYSYTIAITLLYVLLQIAVYEALYFFSEWQRSTLKSEESKQSVAQVQMDSLKVQIEPNFLLNNLNTLVGLIEVNQQRAVIFTQNMTYIYRYLFRASEKTLVSLEEELEFAAIYFALLKNRYVDGIEFLAEAHGASEFRLPPLTLQVLMENAIKHNVVTKLQPLHIYIYLDKRNQKLIVQNNCQPKLVKEGTGKGLQYLQKKYARLHLPKLVIQSSGETFSISVPLQKATAYKHFNI